MSKYRVCANQGCKRKAIDELVPEPHEYHGGKHITLFGWTLFLYKNESEYVTDICYDCSVDQTQKPFKEAYYAGREDGYEKGFNDAPIDW